jgi:hypothetical protein
MLAHFISDRDSKSKSTFWKVYFQANNTKVNLSTSYHPQTDGQTKVVNKSIGNFLMHFGADDWGKLLVFAKFVYNYSKRRSTGFTPFRLNFGFDPKLPMSFSVCKDQHPQVVIAKGPKCPGFNEFLKRIQQAIVDSGNNFEVARQQ